MDEFLTLFYMKRTGKVKGFCTGKQSMDYFADERKDYEKIMNFIVVKYDKFIMDNYQYFEVHNGELQFKKELSF